MRTLHCRILLLVLLVLGAGTAGRADLAGYAGRPDPEFKWTRQAGNMAAGVKIVTLQLRSQVWRGIPWDHQIQVFLPQAPRHPGTAVLYITGGKPGLSDSLLGVSVAQRVEAPVAILYDIPNQPLFDGKNEDDLIAHTFEEYLKSGDDTWPLLFPMVKSAVRAMDALQAYTREEGLPPLEGFVVCGASKRGWTTYLTGAVDRRVRGIAPMVFDNLNFPAQMPRQLELWGSYSEQIQDYTRRGLQQKMETEIGKKLVAMVDPWFYRKQLTMPKLLIHGANDRYWATDATRLYWDELPGEKYLLNIPNAGHGLDDKTRVLNTLSAFFVSVASRTGLPKLSFRHENGNGKVSLSVNASVPPKEMRLWSARAGNTDFRPARWQQEVMKLNGEGFAGELPAPAAGGLAVFAEAEFQVEGRTFTLSTPSAVYGRKPAP